MPTRNTFCSAPEWGRGLPVEEYQSRRARKGHPGGCRRRDVPEPGDFRHVIAAYVERVGGEPVSLFERLTPHQREVLQLIAEGHTSKEIAKMLSLSLKTVDMHRSQLMTTLGIHDVAGLVRYAIRVGLITPDP